MKNTIKKILILSLITQPVFGIVTISGEVQNLNNSGLGNSIKTTLGTNTGTVAARFSENGDIDEISSGALSMAAGAVGASATSRIQENGETREASSPNPGNASAEQQHALAHATAREALFRTRSSSPDNIFNLIPPEDKAECGDEETMCVFESPMDSRIDAFLKIKTTLDGLVGEDESKRESKCKCFKKSINPSVSSREIREEKEDLSRKLRDQLNRRLLNDFASYQEDLHFFIKTTGNVLDKDQSKFFCASEKIRTSVENEPSCRRIFSRNKHQEKLHQLLGSLGSQFEEGDSLSSKIDQIKNEMTGANSGIRTQYDIIRKNAQHDPGMIRVNKILTAFMKDSKVVKHIDGFTQSVNTPPIFSILETIRGTLTWKDNDMLKNIFKPEIVGPDLASLYRDARKVDAIPFGEQPAEHVRLLEAVDTLFFRASQYSPGIDMLLKDGQFFKKASEKLSKNETMFDLFNRDSALMTGEFEKRCNDITAKIAQAVCAEDEDLVKGISQAEMFIYQAGTQDDLRKKQLQMLVSCESGPSNEKSPLLKKALASPEFWKTSEYFARSKGQPTLFDNLKVAMESGGAGAKIVSEIMSRGTSGSIVSYQSSNGKELDFFESPQTAGNTTDMATSKALEGTLQNSQVANSSSGFDRADANVIDGANLYNSGAMGNRGANGSEQRADGTAATAEASSEQSIEDQREDYRREFREYMASKGMDERQINQIVSNSNDEMMKRLMDLREEMTRNQSKIQELSSENERLKLADMQEKINRLERQKAALQDGEPSSARAPRVASSRSDSYLQPNSSVGRGPASIAPQDVGGSSAGSSSTGGFAGSGASSGSGELSRGLASGVSGAGRISASDLSSPVVIAAPAAKTGAIEIKSQEVGLDLLNYLSNNGTDIQTLINLKTSGMIYKYKVLENGKTVDKEVRIEYSNLNEDVQKIIDRKIAQNKDRSQELLRLDSEIQELQRVYSYSTLQFILADQMKQNRNPGL